ncbi:hypothetical protein R3L02_42435 [Streptomyces scabiei]|uniref:hypothetical protein n=1 Tax=Streptomyces scabiei TaxID=1930 RepID=UPI00298F12B0|nr:hypothetical protein [Streptomyces scabiei]MDW8478407.1 hypothetical protein [Streptomyces scabiei]
MMSAMHATQTPRQDDRLDVETFARPEQQRRYIAAMNRIAAERCPGTPVRVYVSAGPKTVNNSNWPRLLERIAEDLPEGVELLHYRTAFEGGSYDWDGFAGQLDGLVVIGRSKRLGSRVHVLGPVARLELRSMVAKKPVLLFTHNLGLIPVVDCMSQVMPPADAPRLKLIAPKRWSRDSRTLNAAHDALRPTGLTVQEPEPRRQEPEPRRQEPEPRRTAQAHLLAPFAAGAS